MSIENNNNKTSVSNTVAQVLIDGRDNTNDQTERARGWNEALSYVANALISRGVLAESFVGGDEVRNNG